MLINEYRQKEKLLRQLQEELSALSEREDLKKELEFKSAIDEVLAKFGKTEADLLELFAKSESAEAAPEQKARRKRTPSKYKNPETGEVIEVRGGRQKNYQDWIEQYGKERVQSWKIG
ncbi:histone-like nucleoid-structuring protein, MvaT/MvaU family [Oceanospirillum sediminis]|uniref:H-NS histone family protein n=1 Tax=Oceanospirillum sediminis TaxID=2760088 RepID=A0A839IS19_9GAMM|nr:histone-like nucleoid-structuring protein, MvaT/MvaU family [Oceanospirillum sediminis]MBB1487460.1 H-NS histone family protein [Oceanospirillum sediminis]